MMKTMMLISVLLLASGLTMAGEPFGNPDLFDGYGARLTVQTDGNENPNPDLYGNGYGEADGTEVIVDHLDAARLNASADENPDLYGGI